MSFGHVCLCMLVFETVCDVVNCQKRKIKTDNDFSCRNAHKVF